MKVLIVCSFNQGRISPYVGQQTLSVEKCGVLTEYFLIRGKGITGYLANYRKLINQIRSFQPDLIHAHYGLSGLLANLQRKVPVVTSFHGSDINLPLNRILSKISRRTSAWSIFVSNSLSELAGAVKNYSVIPCGINMRCNLPVDKAIARQKLHLPPEDKLILFAGSFTNKIKNYPLAKAAVNIINSSVESVNRVKIIELNGYSRDDVNLLINACDVALLTSLSEGSPIFVKEAMACNCPVVATDVGDIRETFGILEGHYITTFHAPDVAYKLNLALTYAASHPEGTKGRKRIKDLGLAEEEIASRIVKIYKTVISQKKAILN